MATPESVEKYIHQLISSQYHLNNLLQTSQRGKNQSTIQHQTEALEYEKFESIYHLAILKKETPQIPVIFTILEGNIKGSPEAIHAYSENPVKVRITDPKLAGHIDTVNIDLGWMCSDETYKDVPIIEDSKAAYLLFTPHETSLQKPLPYFFRTLEELMHLRRDLSQALDSRVRSRINWLSNEENILLLRLLDFRQEDAISKFIKIYPEIGSVRGTQTDSARITIEGNELGRRRLNFAVDYSRKGSQFVNAFTEKLALTGGYDSQKSLRR